MGDMGRGPPPPRRTGRYDAWNLWLTVTFGVGAVVGLAVARLRWGELPRGVQIVGEVVFGLVLVGVFAGVWLAQRRR